MNRPLTMTTGVLTVWLGVGCGGAPDATDPNGTGSDALVSRTLVTLNADGTSAVSYEKVTVAQQQREIAARRQAVSNGTFGDRTSHGGTKPLAKPAIGPADCSIDASTWLFSGPNLTGHQLCLIGAGTEFLGDHLLSCGPPDIKNPGNTKCTSWEGNVGSYWVGASGAFRKDVFFIVWPNDAPNWVPFAYWDYVSTVAPPSFSEIRLDY
jgi:hypothetical protein